VSHDAPTTLRSTIDKVRALIGRQGVDPSGFGIFESGNFVGVFVKPGYRVPDIALPDHLDGFRIVECEAPG
jgi:hypothetical protein